MSPDDNTGLLPPSDLNPRREPVLDYPDREAELTQRENEIHLGERRG